MRFVIAPMIGPVADTVNTVLRDTMSTYGFYRADVFEGRDHDGEPILIIEAKYHRSPAPIPKHATFDLTTRLRERLRTVGERRFPHIRHWFQEGQVVSS